MRRVMKELHPYSHPAFYVCVGFPLERSRRSTDCSWEGTLYRASYFKLLALSQIAIESLTMESGLNDTCAAGLYMGVVSCSRMFLSLVVRTVWYFNSPNTSPSFRRVDLLSCWVHCAEVSAERICHHVVGSPPVAHLQVKLL